VQQCLSHNGLESIPLWIVLIVPFVRILATGLSIGSGGSGGIFGPGIVIGAFLGGAVWRVFDPVFPSMGHDPAPYVIVGMMSCFGGISRAPLAVMLMVAEMTGSLSILTPAMIAVGISWLIVRHADDTMYRSQLKSRSDAPTQRLLAGLPLLAAIPVTRAMAEPKLVVTAQRSADSVKRALDQSGLSGAPLVDEDRRLEGTIARSKLEMSGEGKHLVGDLVDSGAPTVSVTSRLDVALESLTAAPQSWVPVLDDERRVVGTLSVSDVVRAYREELVMSAQRVSELGVTAGVAQVTVTADSPVAGRTLRMAGLPPGFLITSISRGGEVFFPTGDDTLEIGDHLTVIGRGFDLTRIGNVTSIGPTV
jgi:CBS domain-containing protein